jgi:hypothetical protein
MDGATLAGIVLAVSIASERLVEIIKGFVPWLNEQRPMPYEEGKRKAVLQLLAVLAGIGTAYAGGDYIGQGFGEANRYWAIPLVGLLASGGSGLWNSILSYFVQAKDLKKAEAKEARAGASGGYPD